MSLSERGRDGDEVGGQLPGQRVLCFGLGSCHLLPLSTSGSITQSPNCYALPYRGICTALAIELIYH